MKINEALGGISQESHLKVGAENGSSFFYVGSVSDFLGNMDSYSNICLTHATDLYNESKNLYETIKGKQNDENVYQMFFEEQLRKYEYRYKMFEKQFRKFLPLKDRSVIDLRNPNLIIDDSYVIIINGYEDGAYWFYDEKEKQDDGSIAFTTMKPEPKNWRTLVIDGKNYRRRHHITQKQMSIICGMSVSGYRKFEAGKKAPTKKTVSKIASVVWAGEYE